MLNLVFSQTDVSGKVSKLTKIVSMEFINTKITDRKKLLKYFLFIIIPLESSFFVKYYFASKAVQDGIQHSRRMLSYNEFLFYSTTALIVLLITSLASRIVLKLVISDTDKTLTVHLMEKFKFKSKTYTVKLSETQINKSEYKSKDREYNSLQLTNKDFGTLNVTELDFVELNKVIEYFESLRLITASQLRQKRLNSIRRKKNLTTNSTFA